MPGSPSPPEVLDARVRAVKAMLRRGADTSLGFIARIQAQFNVSKATASVYLSRARAELGDAIPLDGDDFDRLFVESLLELAADPTATIAERRKVWETLARFRGRFKQTAAADALAPAGPPPPDLRDPKVLAAQLAYDAAIGAPSAPPNPPAA